MTSLEDIHRIPTAAAFQGMYRWEQACRESCEVMTRNMAKSSLENVVASEAGYLYDIISSGQDSSPAERDDMIASATGQAMYLYDRQYSDPEWYAPSYMEVNKTMEGGRPPLVV